MSKKILQIRDNSTRSTSGRVLRESAKEVPIEEITTAKIKKITDEMSKALMSQKDGVALAAPQIGYSLRIFVVAGKIFEEGFLRNKEKEGGSLPEKSRKKNESGPKDLVFINPKILKLSREKEWVPEGCLSVRPLYGKTFRSKKAIISAYDEDGKKFTRGASGFLAQIFQHETDHLNGILFIDHAKDLHEEALQNEK